MSKSASRNNNLSLAVAILFIISASSWAALFDDGDFIIETVASYPSIGMGQVTDIALDSDGVIYVDHRGDSNQNFAGGSITRIDSTGVITRWIDNLQNARTMIWAGATAFGESLYVVEAGPRIIRKLDTSGNMSSFLNSSNCPRSIDIDRNGSLGGDMFGAPRGTDRILRIKPSGSVSTFSYWPGVVSGGVEDIAISPTSKYNGNIFTAFDIAPAGTANEFDGIYRIDSSGHATRFAPSINYARFLEFDTSGLIFDNDLFVIGRMQDVMGLHLWRIDELGNAEDIMRVRWGEIDHLAFGPDGAMYLAKYMGDTTEILRVSLAPITISIDIMPDSCPNPLDISSRGVLPVAVLGMRYFDVFEIDVASVRLMGVAPFRSNYEDVSTLTADPLECDGISQGPDGFTDLTLKFDKKKVIKALRGLKGVPNRTDVPLTLTLKLLVTDEDYQGEDCVEIIKPKPHKHKKPKTKKKPKAPKKK